MESVTPDRGGEFEPVKDILARITGQPGESIPAAPAEAACPICRGTGWLHRVTPAGKVLFDQVVSCQCRAAETRVVSVRLSRLPTEDSARLSNFQVIKGTEVAFRAAVRMADGTAPHHFLTLAGLTGRGKTHLARGIGWAWIEQARGTVLYFKVAAFLDELRKGYDRKPENQGEMSGFDRLMDRASRVKLLILDDLGVEKSTEWSIDKLDSIIDYRYENRLATVITTNLAPGQLGARIESRLKGGVSVTIESNRDYREIQAKQRKGETK